jgi:hypothetical protein
MREFWSRSSPSWPIEDKIDGGDKAAKVANIFLDELDVCVPSGPRPDRRQPRGETDQPTEPTDAALRQFWRGNARLAA